MILSFELDMPSKGSWDGRWSGEGNLYAKVVSLGRSKVAIEKAKQILEKEYFYYNFGDGWSASVTVREVDNKEAARIRRKSKGFCGYDWMVQSIIDKGIITTGNTNDE